MKKQEDFASKALYTFLLTLVILLPINFFGGLIFYDEPRFPLGLDLTVAAVAALAAYLRALRRYTAGLEERIQKLEQQTGKR